VLSKGARGSLDRLLTYLFDGDRVILDDYLWFLVFLSALVSWDSHVSCQSPVREDAIGEDAEAQQLHCSGQNVDGSLGHDEALFFIWLKWASVGTESP
jgi:hypothetical protein